MKELTNEDIAELRKIQLSMLGDIDTAFKKHNIRYVAMFGTLLGCIRHEGYIPWDDDIDIGVPRKDYDYLIENFDSIFPANYAILTPDNCQHFEFFFSKIHNKNTTYIENNCLSFPDRHTGVFIDIFPLEGAPSNLKFQKKYAKKIVLLQKLNTMLRFNPSFGRTLKEKVIISLFTPLRMILPYNYFYKKYLNMINKYNYEKEQFYTYPTAIINYNFIFKKEYIETIIPRKFEDLMIMTPYNADKILRQTFGDYMTLPPIEQRVGHHFVEVLDFGKSFKEYKSF